MSQFIAQDPEAGVIPSDENRSLVHNRFIKILSALRFPSTSSFNIEDLAELSKAVAWLEDRKIRQYVIEARQPLREANAKWFSAFDKYLQDLGCPYTNSEQPAQRLQCFQWLLGRAVAFEYEDQGSIYNARAKVVAKDAQKGLETKEEEPSTRSSQETTTEVLQALCTRLGIDYGNDITENLKILRLAIQVKYGSLEEMSKIQKGNNQRVKMDQFPLGFTTDDAMVDQAAKLLKMLYLTDLRNLQSAVNNILVTAQEFTANPKTNTALGKVGR